MVQPFNGFERLCAGARHWNKEWRRSVHGVLQAFERADLEHGAQKFQAGTPDVAGPVGLAAAVRFFEEAGWDAVLRHDRELAEYGLERLLRIPRLRLIGPAKAGHRAPVFTFTMDGKSPVDVAKALDAEGIAVRAGDMAALPLLRRFNTSEAVRASGIKLVLDGYKTWGVQMRGFHALLRDAGIDHAYGETRREMHRWDTAWLSDCVDALARRAGTAGGESVEPVR